VRLLNLAIREGQSDDTLPDPEFLSFALDEIDFIYEVWTLWAATGKKFLPSQLIPEMQAGYGRILTGVLEMESYYEKVKADQKKKKKKSTDQNG
jgi:hypothetical protein